MIPEGKRQNIITTGEDWHVDEEWVPEDPDDVRDIDDEKDPHPYG